LQTDEFLGRCISAATELLIRVVVEQKAVVVVLGTRPEAIKMAPVILALRRQGRFRTIVISTAQHTCMLDQALAGFGIVPDVNLELMRPGGSLGSFLASALEPLSQLLGDIRPALTLVQGDTMTVLAAAQAAFFERLPVAHIEAGLRSGDMKHPFPEEAARRMVSLLVNYHFAPTARSRQNLLDEGVPSERIWVTGNTIVDALQQLRPDHARNEVLRSLDFSRSRVLLVTAHRRENQGAPMRDICGALRDLVGLYPDVEVVFPVHLSPAVQDLVRFELEGVGRVHLTEPLSYDDLLYSLRHCELVLTDSGGIQEEAPSFDRPMLILRGVTERPEVIDAGAGILVGTNRETIVQETSRLLDDDAAYDAMAHARNPFGDGHASERIVGIIGELLSQQDDVRAVTHQPELARACSV
jgi:UDP-N-acetylglucosamine 2-epimerase (non-hydrolysing)